MADVPASGTQHTLRSGDYEAVVASVGASLRSLTHAGRDLVVPFRADQVRPAYRGVTLVPWPNRVVDGRYTDAGTQYQLPLTEPERGHALHGLGVWLDWATVASGPSHVVLETVVQPQTGYPWRLLVRTEFTLDADGGLTQTVTAVNESDTPAPYGTGPHPYLVAGDGTVDDWTLELPAADLLQVTPDRLVPISLAPAATVDADRFDYLSPRRIGPAEIDHAYTGLQRDAAGNATVRLTDADGRGVAITWDAACPWVQVHTADLMPGAPGHRAGLAVEPMTCAPDAFNAGEYPYDAGLRHIAPGASSSAGWRILAIH
ncbi:galactose mutarotase [Microbacterium mangrovi]|uniref:Galactose mutarotase n=1 Tax=Microbacterium mangrovi TaxID=1348253 RepID=A0A0B2A9Q8_9MICO|nr:aldose 1-epimerase family protein [Microbacterium mangrovi]KHK99899.1 galactose mutarotase [Microbacterium mangrovi]